MLITMGFVVVAIIDLDNDGVSRNAGNVKKKELYLWQVHSIEENQYLIN